MRKRLIALIGLFLLLVASVPTTTHASAKVAGYILNGYNLQYDGLHAYVSTTIGPGGYQFQLYNKTGSPAQSFYTSQIRPKDSCIEADVLHTLNTSTGAVSHTFGVYNWCTGQWVVTYDIKNDATFRSKYAMMMTWNDTGVPFNDEVLEVRVVNYSTSPVQWAVYLYNQQTATYDLITVVTGGTAVQGYLTFESVGATMDAPNAYCPNFNYSHTFQIRGIQLRHGPGVWSTLTANDFTYIANTMHCLPTIWVRYYDPANPQKLRWSDNYINW